MNGIVAVMKKVAEQEVERILTTELGIVTAVFTHAAEDDKDNYQCSITLKGYTGSDGSAYELRKVPVATAWMGMACIPKVDDLVLLNFIGGNINAPVIVGCVYNDEDRPPLNNEGEFLLQHSLKQGGSLKLDKEGVITLTSKNAKNVLTVSDQKISAEGEKYQIILDIEGDKISLIADQDIDIKSSSGALTLKANDIKLQGSVVVEGELDVK